MNKTPDSVAQEIAAIRASLAQVSAAVDKYAEIATRNVSGQNEDANGHANGNGNGNANGTAHKPTDIVTSGELSDAHTALFMQCHALLRTARGPVDMIFSHFENSAHSGALRAVLEMGVFEAIPVDATSTSATVIAEKLGVDKDLLVRLMRIVTIVGPFAEVGVEEYAHTPYSQMYLVPALRGLFKLMYDEFAPPNNTLYDFFRTHGFRTPASELINPYCFAHRTGDLNIWSYIGQFPERLAALNAGMAGQSEAANWTVGIFPFADELGKAIAAASAASPAAVVAEGDGEGGGDAGSSTKEEEKEDERVLLVDIGGGKGHVTKQIRKLTEGIKGKIILQDRPEVLAEIEDELEGIERMEYDFFTPQPIKGAYIYYIRRCLHDWSDSQTLAILRSTVSAMTSSPSRSRLLISEIVLPDTGADVESGWMDMTMLAVSGTERSEAHWGRLLGEVGLKVVRVYRAGGTNYGVLEAVVA